MSVVYRHCERCHAEMPASRGVIWDTPRHWLCGDCTEAFDQWVKAGANPGETDNLVDWQRALASTIWRIPDDHGPASGYALDTDGDVWVRQPDLRWKEANDDEHEAEPWSQVADEWGPMTELRPAAGGTS